MFGSLSELANFMMSGYWASPAGGGGLPRQWQSPSISVNITNLTPAEQVLARDAFADWSAVCNLTFTFSNGPAQITFFNTAVGRDGSPSAFADTSNVQGQFLQTVTVNINSAFAPIGNGPDGVGSYLFQTYVHEIGHALGLGHTGPYNAQAAYGVNNIFTNDTWQWSVMSYFSQNNFNGSSFADLVTPEMADIFAVQLMYGSPTTSVVNTTYGFNSTAGAIYNFAEYRSGAPAFTIFNTGANNTLDASGYTQNQTINLNPGQWSSIGGLVNNIGIYTTTNIANAIGGSGNDLIIPNGSLTQKGILTGGGGIDTFQGTQAGLNQYKIADMQVGDIINVTDANLSLAFNLTGSTLNYGTNNQITFLNNPVGKFTLSTDTIHGGVDLTFGSTNPPLSGLPVSVSDLLTLQRGIQFFTNNAEATAEAAMINATPTTESVFTYAAKLINNQISISQVAMADFALMTRATDTVAHLTTIANNFLGGPNGQVAFAVSNSFNPTVFAAEAYGSALSTNADFNANFVTPFASNQAGFAAAVSTATGVNAGAILNFVSNWTTFFTAHPESLQDRTVTQAAFGSAFGDAVGSALVAPTSSNLMTVFSTIAGNGFSPNTVRGLVANALIDNAEGLYTAGVSLNTLPRHVLLQGEFNGGEEQISPVGQPPHSPFQGEFLV